MDVLAAPQTRCTNDGVIGESVGYWRLLYGFLLTAVTLALVPICVCGSWAEQEGNRPTGYDSGRGYWSWPTEQQDFQIGGQSLGRPGCPSRR